MRIKKLIFSIVIYSLSITNLYSLEADVFVQSTINRASEVLSKDLAKNEKIKQLKKIAKDTVDIKRIGFYTLGPIRKSLSEDQKNKYLKLFEEYFLISFSNRLVVYSNPDIDVYDKEILSDKFVIVNSLLKGSDERPEVKIDWRIYTKNPDKPLILDLIIEGLSLARTQKRGIFVNFEFKRK